jgi:hypothetical protein
MTSCLENGGPARKTGGNRIGVHATDYGMRAPPARPRARRKRPESCNLLLHDPNNAWPAGIPARAQGTHMDIEAEALAILQELGPLSEAIDIVHQNAPGDWSLLVFETRRFDVTLDAAHGRLVLATSIGVPEPAIWGETASALLAYNLLWQQTGGAYFAQEGTQGAIRLLMQVPVAGLRAAALDTLLQGLAGTADAWADTLAQPAPSAPSPQSSFPGHGLMA